MSAALRSLPSHTPRPAEEVLTEVNALVGVLRVRAPETERLRRMHPDNLHDLTEAGVFRLAMPTDVGGYQADENIVPRSSRRSPAAARQPAGCARSWWLPMSFRHFSLPRRPTRSTPRRT